MNRTRNRRLRSVARRSSQRNRQKAGWFKRHDGTIKLLLAVVGVLFGVNEYLKRQHDGRIQRSLGIYERYQANEVLKARLGIDRVWNNEGFWRQLTTRQDANGRLYFDDMVDLARAITRTRKNVDNLFVIWSISSEASLCLSRRQCDQATVCQMFWHETQKYYYFFKPYFDARNVAWDETVQNREAISNAILEEHCGNRSFLNLNATCKSEEGRFCNISKRTRRYFHEIFNLPVGV